MITIEQLYKVYGDTVACDIPSLQIGVGERIGLVGNNGAGKTTLLSLMLDLIQADRGHVRIRHSEIHQDESWKKYTAAYLDEHFLIDYLTPDEYFDFIGKIRGIPKEVLQDRLDQLDTFFANQIRGKKKYIRDLSKGNMKKVGIGSTIISEPDLLLLDEPFANLDPSTQFELQRLIRGMPKERTIFISSHDLTHISEVCDRIIIVEDGRIVKDLNKTDQTLLELKTYFSSKSTSHEV